MLSSVFFVFMGSVALGIPLLSLSSGNFAFEVPLFFEKNSVIIDLESIVTFKIELNFTLFFLTDNEGMEDTAALS